MTPEAADKFVVLSYNLAFRRAPSDREREVLANQLVSGELTPEGALRVFVDSKEYLARRGVESQFPTGHYHSPVVDPKTVSAYVERERAIAPQDIPGISLDAEAMRSIWTQQLDFTRTCPFRSQPNGTDRYSFGNGPFPEGDGITLRMMFAHLRPRRVIEIGSGFSSACMLDSADHLNLTDFHLTCIEPYPERLRSLLRTTDAARVTVLEKGIQEVSAAIVDDLQPNDILFIDSTHVMKTGSDVHYEFFHLMPRIKPGVIIHFHDITYSFEYPNDWIFKRNYSWNEIYALRALLTHQRRYRVMYWNVLLWRTNGQQMRKEFPLETGNPGSSIWIECMDENKTTW